MTVLPAPARGGERRGLTAAEVRRRVEAGQVNRTAARPSRTVGQILRANILTRFNALLGALFVVIVVVGPIQDALFGAVIVANSAVGIVQELRAKRTLDRLSVLSAPTATVVRDWQEQQVAAEEVVLDDVLVVGAGDQLVVDGVVLHDDGLEVDESLLTGESEPVPKDAGDPVLSGSFVAAGTGRLRATRVGEAAYAVVLAAEARRFTLVHSEIRDSLNRLLKVITWVLVPTAVLLFTTQLLMEAATLDEAIRGSVAGVVGMVPEGLVLLTSLAFALGVIRLGSRGVLVQELPAIEGLARVDVVGIDKTGTLTEGTMAVGELLPLDGASTTAAAEALGALAHADERPNASMRALAEEYDAPGWSPTSRIAFSSARKWSGISFAGHGSWILGAPEMLLDANTDANTDASAAADAHAGAGRGPLALASGRAATGHRVLLLARTDAELVTEEVPRPLEPVALVVLAERVRPDAADTLRYFAEEGVAVKVISGDSHHTVGAVADSLGLPGADRPVDARGLPEEAGLLGRSMEGASVFGRVSPHQKRGMVQALQQRGHVVAMTGDGVNDVLALKEADIGIAMGGGAQASRAVAQLVLLKSRFDVLPDVVAEGRRIIGNVERVANLFLTKTVYVSLLALAVGVAQLPFPFFPRHLTIISTLTIGVPAFFLALAPNRRRARPDFLKRVLRFAVPAGAVAATATFAGYAVVGLESDLGQPVARTTATVVLFGVGMTVLALLAYPWDRWELLLIGTLVAAFALLHLLPWTREFFALSPLPPLVWASALGLVALAAAALVAVRRFARRGEPEEEPGPAQ
ncbi:MAG: HAD-IC family P-type ATPase [Actinomycetota bacterium]